MIPIDAPWRIPDIGMFIIKIGNNNTKNARRSGCLRASTFTPRKKIALEITLITGYGQSMYRIKISTELKIGSLVNEKRDTSSIDV